MVTSLQTTNEQCRDILLAFSSSLSGLAPTVTHSAVYSGDPLT